MSSEYSYMREGDDGKKGGEGGGGGSRWARFRNRDWGISRKAAVVVLAAVIVLGGVAAYAAFSLSANVPGTITTSTTTSSSTTTTTTTTVPAVGAQITSAQMGASPCIVSANGLTASCNLYTMTITTTTVSVTTFTVDQGGAPFGTPTVTGQPGGQTFQSATFAIQVKNTGSGPWTPVVHGTVTAGVASLSADPTPTAVAPGATVIYSWTVTAVAGGSFTVTGTISA